MNDSTLPSRPWFKYIFSGLTVFLLLLAAMGSYVAVRFWSHSASAALVWALPAFVFFLMALLPAIFYLCLKLNVRNGFFYFAQRYCVRLYFPLILFLGERLRIDKELLVKELVQYNNKYVIKRHGNTLAPQDLLILLPHCLQVRDCDYRVTTDIGRCVGCGRCSIHHFVRIGKEYGVNICTATGGTLARRIIREQRPRAIVAVACSRDLYSGLSDTFPLPVVGVFNQLHHGPCIDTSVDTSAVEGAVRQLLQKNYV